MVYFTTQESRCKRKTMEDLIGFGKINLKELYDIFFVIDGHSGIDVASFVKENMIFYLEKNKNYGSMETIIDKTFFDLDLRMKENKLKGGAVISMVILNDKFLYIVSLGDCTVDFYDFDNSIKIFSEIHDCKNINESKRIKKIGYDIFENRIEGILEPTRAFGDFSFKKNLYDFLNPVSFKPTIIKQKISKNFFIFLTTDGLHHIYKRNNLFNNLLKNIKHNVSLNKISSLLKQRAIKDNCQDNISFILIKNE